MTHYTGYGWWAYKTATGFIVDAFTVESSGRFAGNRRTMRTVRMTSCRLTGTATYKAVAAGKFAIDNRPLGTHLEAGHFTADRNVGR